MESDIDFLFCKPSASFMWVAFCFYTFLSSQPYDSMMIPLCREA